MAFQIVLLDLIAPLMSFGLLELQWKLFQGLRALNLTFLEQTTNYYQYLT